jgi:integrase
MNQYSLQDLPFTLEQRMHIYQLKVVTELVGLYSADKWSIKDLPQLKFDRKTHFNFDFNFFENMYIRNEVKYFFFSRIKINSHNISGTLFNYRSYFKRLAEFIKQFYPTITSITQIPREVIVSHFRAQKDSDRNTVNSGLLGFHSRLHSFYMELYDERSEYEKDYWSADRLGVDYNKTICTPHFNFKPIHQPYKDLVKKYIYSRLVVQKSVSASMTNGYLSVFYLFFPYILKTHPDWTNLNFLSRSDIIGFIEYCRETPMGGSNTLRAKKATDEHIIRCVSNVEVFVDYIQRNKYVEAPSINIKSLFFAGDKPNSRRRSNENNTKYISDHIWYQVVANIHLLSNEIVIIILLMEATGFRISDVLTLKLNCLLNKDDGYWIVGDQRKVNETNHQVPVTNEIAQIVQAQKLYLEGELTNENPDSLLFPILSGPKRGQPFLSTTIRHHLNKLAKQCDIKDENGDLYKFTNHAFRHRYGVTLVNNGMSILHVQKLMAHASPEMTIVYAQILDKTKKSEWEQANNKGAVRLKSNGDNTEADLNGQALEQGLELEWVRHNFDSIRLDHGFCIKSPKVNCSFLEHSIEAPCIKNNCPSFHVDKSFLPYYEQQISKMESDIAIYKSKNRLRSIEIMQPKLIRYKELVQLIQTGETIMGMKKKLREYSESEKV